MATMAMHAICHREDGRPTNFRNINPKEGVYGSGWWIVGSEALDGLVGGWIYLHESSNQRSHFAGKIEGIGGVDEQNRYELIVRKQRISDQAWRGDTPGQNPKHYFRIVPATYPHESSERHALEHGRHCEAG